MAEQFPKLVEGYNLLIWEHEDGSASYTGSFNRSEWERYLADSGKQDPAADEAAEPSLEDETKDSLKEKLEEKGLPTSGNKAELVERLREADSEGS